jgi:hypothetical protein
VRLIKPTISAQNPSLVGGAEPADVAIIARGNTSANPPAGAQFNGNQNQTFLGGPPDSAVDTGGNINFGAAGLGAAIAAWTSAMKAAGMGWLAVSRQDDVQILSAAQQVNGTVLFTLQRPTTAPVVLNKLTTVRVRAVNQGQSPLNGQLNGTFTALDKFLTYAVIGIPTPQIGGAMRIYTPNPVFLPYDDIQAESRTGQHDRGRPFGSPRGRQRRRVRG